MGGGEGSEEPEVAAELSGAGTRVRGSSMGVGLPGSSPGQGRQPSGAGEKQVDRPPVATQAASAVPTGMGRDGTLRGSSRSRDFQAPPRFRFSNPGT